ncbi:MAG: lysophospholipid acyltransferase family protein [Candidatus Limivicinus sp.]|jgi:1-acyl-sn-glycerol-3-phosphate acyltransferase
MLVIIFSLIALAVSLIYFFAVRHAVLPVLIIFAVVFLALNLLFILILGVGALFVNKKKPIKKQSGFCRVGCAAFASLFMSYFGVHSHVSGTEKLPSQGRFLFVCNHRSIFDPFIVIEKLDKYNISFISKPSNMKIPIVGNIAYGAGFLPIDRENDRKALRTVLRAVEYLKKDMCSIAVYPEGTRNRGGGLLPFHAGSFKIAQKAKVPVVVACVRGTENVKKRFPFRATDVYMDILEVIPAEKVAELSSSQLADYSSSLMLSQLEAESGVSEEAEKE